MSKHTRIICGTFIFKKSASSKKGGIQNKKNYNWPLLEVNLFTNYLPILVFGSKSVRVSHKRQYLRRLDFEPITIRSQ